MFPGCSAPASLCVNLPSERAGSAQEERKEDPAGARTVNQGRRACARARQLKYAKDCVTSDL